MVNFDSRTAAFICCRRLRTLARATSLPQNLLLDSPIPVRVAKLQLAEEAEFFDSAYALDLHPGNVESAVGFLVRVRHATCR